MSVDKTSQVDGKKTAASVKRRIINLLETIKSLAGVCNVLHFLWIQVLPHQENIDFCKDILISIIS